VRVRADALSIRDLCQSPVAALCERRRAEVAGKTSAVTDRRYSWGGFGGGRWLRFGATRRMVVLSARDLRKNPVAALCERRCAEFTKKTSAVTDRRYNWGGFGGGRRLRIGATRKGLFDPPTTSASAL
jgi:hypothetical protein